MKLFLNIILVLFTLPLLAQVNVEEELTLETLQNQNILQEAKRGAFILQVGEANQASINAKDEQVARVIQEGNLNILNLDLEGLQNNATVLQKGNQNEYNLMMTGTENKLTVVQDGDENKVTQNLQNVDGLEVELIQIGTGHELIQTGAGAGESPIQVIQQGTGMKVMIEKKGF